MSRGRILSQTVWIILLIPCCVGLELNHLDEDTQIRVQQTLFRRYSDFGQRIQQVLEKIDVVSKYESQTVNISFECLEDINTWTVFVSNFTEWAGRMLDAWGAPQSGYLEGDSVWEGSWPECSRVDDITTGIRGRHCLTGWDGVMLYDGFGTCLPVTCSANDVKNFLIAGTDDLADLMPPLWSELGGEAAETYCTLPIEEKNITQDASAMAAIAVLSFFGLMVVIGTIYDLATMKRREPAKAADKPEKTTELSPDTRASGFHIPRPSINGSLRPGVNGGLNGRLPSYGGEVTNPVFDYSSESLDPKFETHENQSHSLPSCTTNDLGKGHIEGPQPIYTGNGMGAGYVGDSPGMKQPLDVQREPWKPDTCGKFLLAFSVRQHAPRILNFDHPKGSIQCLNGVRVLAFCWIVLGHSWQIGIIIANSPTVANKFRIFENDNRPTQLVIRNGAQAVETFFILSALLTTISFLNKLKKKKPNCEMMGTYFFHRFWRLTPVYMLILMTFACLFNYFTTGPFNFGPEVDTEYAACKRDWWKHLLYVNNLINPNPGYDCMSWTWYMANDFQFYVMAPIFLFPLFYLPTFGIVLTVLGLCGGLIANIYLHHKLIMGFDPDNFLAGYFDIYIRPWTRCTTYFSGILLGYVLWRKNFKVKMNRGGVAVAWILMIALSTVLIYVEWDEVRDPDTYWGAAGRITFDSLKKTAYGLVICWVIFACTTGYGGFINSILSWNGWLPFARLSYTGYLFHPILIMFYYYQRPVQFYMNDMDMAFLFVAFLFLSVGAAFLLSLFLEVPFAALEKLMFANTPNNWEKPDVGKSQAHIVINTK